MLSGLAVGVLYLVARAASMVSLLGLMYGALLLLFTLPKLYEMRKDEIDGALDRLRAQVEGSFTRAARRVRGSAAEHATADFLPGSVIAVHCHL